MNPSQHSALFTRSAAPIFTPVDLDAIDTKQLARAVARNPEQPRPQFLVDCGNLKCLRTMGVSYVVSQLLALRQCGSGIWLRNAHPAVQRSLRILHLEGLFPVVK